ncbi:hypothetical protein F4809DRAFT_112254 [Biscogniauxia mediterranea]|nr:hypothetical protein F4809DRAFT_112254 [Biscogniauxia mediterranea]
MTSLLGGPFLPRWEKGGWDSWPILFALTTLLRHTVSISCPSMVPYPAVPATSARVADTDTDTSSVGRHLPVLLSLLSCGRWLAGLRRLRLALTSDRLAGRGLHTKDVHHRAHEVGKSPLSKETLTRNLPRKGLAFSELAGGELSRPPPPRPNKMPDFFFFSVQMGYILGPGQVETVPCYYY